MLSLLRRHPLLAYYALTFLLSWGVLFLSIGGVGGFPATPQQAEDKLPVVVFELLTGPSISGVLLTAVLYGKPGLKERISQRFLRLGRGREWYTDPWRVSLLVPITIGCIQAFLCLLVSSALYAPTILIDEDKAGRILVGIAYGLAAGTLEELGWSGWAVPETRKQYNVVVSGLSVGLVWGFWHFLVAVWGSGGPNGEFDLDLFIPWIPWNLLVLPFFRVLMVCLHGEYRWICSILS